MTDITSFIRSITIEQVTVKFPTPDPRTATYAGSWTRSGPELRDAFRAIAKPGRPRRGYRSRAWLAGTGPTDGRLPRRSARTAGARRRRHLT